MASRLRRWLEGVWYEGRSGAALLAPLAALFGVVSGLRRLAYRSGLRPRYRASVPVVVVGNLSVGGTGKSPVVAAVVDALQRRGLRVGILARGYGVELREPREVVAGVTARVPSAAAARQSREASSAAQRMRAGERMLSAPKATFTLSFTS